MNNIGDQGGGEHDEIYMNKDSIKTLKFIRPAGNVILPSQNSYFLEDPDQLEYEEAPLNYRLQKMKSTVEPISGIMILLKLERLKRSNR